MMNNSENLSCKAAAYALHLKVRTVYEYMRLGKLRPTRVAGKHPHFTRDYIENVKLNGYDPIDIHAKENAANE